MNKLRWLREQLQTVLDLCLSPEIKKGTLSNQNTVTTSRLTVKPRVKKPFSRYFTKAVGYEAAISHVSVQRDEAAETKQKEEVGQ